MNFIYGLETGRRLDDRRSSNKSKTKAFFAMVRSIPTWRFLEPYESEIRRYDDAFRTPEFHKHSTIRAALLRGELLNITEILNLVNRGGNNIWENVVAIVSGVKPSAFCDLHLGPDGQVDKRYLE